MPEQHARAYLHRPGLQISLVVLAQVMALTCWFSVSAVAPDVQSELGLHGFTAVLLTSSVQVGFACGAVASALVGVADRVAAPVLFTTCALLAAASTVAVAVAGSGTVSVLALRFLTGAALAGVYPVGMKLVATWARPERRGLALGSLVGALTLGSALPYAIRGSTELPWREVLLAAAAITAGGAILTALLVRTGPRLARATTFRPRDLAVMVATPDARRANIGYVGHMWELYALWTALPAYLAVNPGLDGEAAFVLAFAAIGVAGSVGCLAGGAASDRWGRGPAAATALLISGTCCLLSPFAVSAPVVVVVVFVAVWGASVIADSAVFSSALSDSVDERHVGTALTAQTAVGYLVTASSIHLVALLGSATSWQWALLVLAVGPAVAAPSIARFGRHVPPTG